jgi:hypothetical protein
MLLAIVTSKYTPNRHASVVSEIEIQWICVSTTAARSTRRLKGKVRSWVKEAHREATCEKSKNRS